MLAMTRRHLAQLAGLLAMLAGVGLAFAPARVTWLNTGLRIDYPWGRGGAALLAALGAAALGALLRRRLLRGLAVALAAVFLLLAGRLLVYRLEAGPSGLSQRDLLGLTRVAWTEVARVETGGDTLVITDRAEVELRVGLGDLAPDQRASLERTIARRVREGSLRTATPP
jgi:hypothetical protein